MKNSSMVGYMLYVFVLLRGEADGAASTHRADDVLPICHGI